MQERKGDLMNEKERKKVQETIGMIMQLDMERLIMVNVSAKTLLMQQQAEESREKKVLVNEENGTNSAA